MLEDYVGETPGGTACAPISAPTGSATPSTDDLWRAVETAAGRPITAIAHDFTLQPGVPLIRVDERALRRRRDPGRAAPGPVQPRPIRTSSRSPGACR